jgi:chemotaxis protein CheZ
MNATNDTYTQLGGIVRQLHDALSTLGYDVAIREIAGEIPDARDRLSYVRGMTESAANKVLNLVDAATPSCDDLAGRSADLQRRLHHHLGGGADSPAADRSLLNDCLNYVQHVNSEAETLHSTFTDIMMAQDFQDLSGQVIGKVIDIISRTEAQLVELLLHSAAQGESSRVEELAGPQVPEKAMQQDDVDDLLASLGF